MRDRTIQILVLDDDSDTAEIVRHLLSSKGYKVKTASTSEQGLTMLGQSTFHVLILDLRLPEVDGIELLKQIRQRDKDLAIIVLTAYPSVESAVASLKGGVSDYVQKPIDSQKLLDSIESVVREKGLLSNPEEGLLRKIGAKVRKERKDQRLTLKQVARRTGLSVSLISQIERAESAASVASLYKIASALGTKLEKIFEGC